MPFLYSLYANPATIAALSEHKLSGGKYNLKPLYLASLCIISLNLELALTPPPVTKDFTLYLSIAFIEFSTITLKTAS